MFICSVREAKFKPFTKLIYMTGLDPLGRELVQAIQLPWPEMRLLFGEETPMLLDGMVGQRVYEKIVDLMGPFYATVNPQDGPSEEMVEVNRLAQTLLRWGRLWPEGVFQVTEV